MIVDRYYYHQLNKQEQAIYKAFYKGVMSHQEIIPIPVRGEFSQESFERIFMAMTRDNPLIYFLNQSACSTACDMFGRLAICPQYFFTKEKVKEYNRKIEKVVNELAGQLHLLEYNDYEKELRVHDWICQNVEYDYEGTDKDKVSRVIASHNILGVFAHHKAQCEGIAKAVKVLLNAVDVKCIVVTGDSIKSGQCVPHAWNMLELTIYGIGFFLCTLLIQYMLFKFRKNHNYGPNGVWVGNRAIMVLCGVGIVNHRMEYLAAILGFICADEVGKAAGWH